MLCYMSSNWQSPPGARYWGKCWNIRKRKEQGTANSYLANYSDEKGLSSCLLPPYIPLSAQPCLFLSVCPLVFRQALFVEVQTRYHFKVTSQAFYAFLKKISSSHYIKTICTFKTNNVMLTSHYEGIIYHKPHYLFLSYLPLAMVYMIPASQASPSHPSAVLLHGLSSTFCAHTCSNTCWAHVFLAVRHFVFPKHDTIPSYYTSCKALERFGPCWIIQMVLTYAWLVSIVIQTKANILFDGMEASS